MAEEWRRKKTRSRAKNAKKDNRLPEVKARVAERHSASGYKFRISADRKAEFADLFDAASPVQDEALPPDLQELSIREKKEVDGGRSSDKAVIASSQQTAQSPKKKKKKLRKLSIGKATAAKAAVVGEEKEDRESPPRKKQMRARVPLTTLDAVCEPVEHAAGASNEQKKKKKTAKQKPPEVDG